MEKRGQSYNFIVSLFLTLVVIFCVSFIGDYYFDLNDDVLIKDILSGVYTGTPEGHNIQMLYPISALIAAFYKVAGGADWYGIFLCACQFLCIFLIFNRTLKYRVSALLPELGLIFGAVCSHLLFVQYTYTCGMLSATAAFLILTAEEDERKKYSLKLSFILIILAFLIRSEMLMLTLPMVLVAILIKWLMAKHELPENAGSGDRKAIFRKYISYVIILAAGLLASQIIHNIAYSGKDWREFNRLFDERTELYDFQYIPDYEENKVFYDSIGLSGSEVKLLENYNYGLDDEIDADTLKAVAEYAAGLKTIEISIIQKISTAFSEYLYRLRHFVPQRTYSYPMTDFPWNICCLLLYLIAFMAILAHVKRGSRLTQILGLLLLFACRTTLWLYIIVRGRDPVRITHPLYLVEIMILLGIILYIYRDIKSKTYCTIIIAAAILLAAVPNQIRIISAEMSERAKMRSHYAALYDYFEDNEDKFFFLDVYTSVSCADAVSALGLESEATFSEKMFEEVNNSESNHDIMGGWASKSPLYYKKLSGNGFFSMQDALLQDDVYFVQLISYDTDWLNEYYNEKGYNIEIIKEDVVADVFAIYKITGA